MKKLFLLGVVAILANSMSYAKILRLGFTGTALAGVDFSALDAAIAAAATGDTILVYPGNWSAGNSFNKRLNIIGAGYFLSGDHSNTGPQLLTGDTFINCDLYAGSDGSVFEGLGGSTGISTIGAYYDNVVNNIKIRRCRLERVYPSTLNCNGWQISQSWIENLIDNWGGDGSFKNLMVLNCYISYIGINSANWAGQISNCTIGHSIISSGSALSFQSNIFSSPNFNDNTNAIFQNNVFCNATAETLGIPIGNGNKFSVNPVGDDGITNLLFVDYPNQSANYSMDGQYKLKTGSVAIGAGVGGVDCGMYGGSNPYRLSGIPAIPAFYKLTAPSANASANPYTVTFSVKANN